MSDLLRIHPDNPQTRLIEQVVRQIEMGGVIVYPTDSGYALGCAIGNKKGMERIARIRQIAKDHNFTLVCQNLSEISTFANVDNINYRLIKSLTPGPYTFILPASREVPKRLQQEKRKTIGIRIPDNPICLDMLRILNEPIMSSTLIMPGDTIPMTDPYEINLTIGHAVDAVIDGGFCGMEPTSVVALDDDAPPSIIREGQGDLSWLTNN